MTDLSSLIERLGKLYEASRDVDALIEVQARRFQAYAVGLTDATRARWQPVGIKGEVEEGGSRYHSPEYTRSIDAIVALIGKVLPGWFRWICEGKDERDQIEWSAVLANAPHGPITANHKHPAIALCIALLQALERQGKNV